MIEHNEKIRLLKKLIEKSRAVKVESSSDPEFKNWKNLVERTFVKVYGKDSTEFEHFSKLRFFFPAIVYTSNSDYSADHLKSFRSDFKILIDSINQYIEDLEEETELKAPDLKTKNETNTALTTKIFVSHASVDSSFVEELIEILESIGLDSNQIFCTSFEGYGIELGEDFLASLKNELQGEVLVLFVLSKSFYNSPVCLCEMGASWVLSKNHIPILIPPMDYSDVKGVIPLTQGLKINEPLKLNLLKEKIESLFGIDKIMSMSTWERKRDRALLRIENLISKS